MGLHKNSLIHLVDDIISIDEYSSKMGEDRNIITLCFNVSDEDPAKDLVNFLEIGHDFILDSSASPGEQDDGFYKVFAELERNENCVNYIDEILTGVKKVAGIDEFKFRFYKDIQKHPATIENLKNFVVTDPEKYGIKKESLERKIKKFFEKSFADSVKLDNTTLLIEKRYAGPLAFKLIKFDTKDEVFDNLTESYNYNDFGEVIYLVKYLGDYDITKYGDNIIIERGGQALVARRLLC